MIYPFYEHLAKELVMSIIKKRWNFISAYTNISKKLLFDIVSFIFDSSYFTFDNETYAQLDGSAMGNPASPILANLVMNELITCVLDTLPFDIPLMKIYVDDSILAVPMNRENEVLQYFNSYHRKIQFTCETENNYKISFLDVEITRKSNGTLLTNWFTKPTSTGRILNYHSNHSLTNKVGTVKGLLYRIYTLSSAEFHYENIEKVKKILRANNYPLAFINRCVNGYGTNKIKGSKQKNSDNGNKLFCKFPYIPKLSENINRCFKNTHTQLAFYSYKTIGSIFTKLKDKTPKQKQTNVVYKIPCSCEKCYIGQTKQYLQSRLNQHKNDCKNHNQYKNEKTALALHHFETGHNFLFDNVEILDKESNFRRRNISEMIHINLNDTVNMRSDTLHLSAVYSNILKQFSQTQIK